METIMPILLDHLFIVFMGLVYPIVSFVSFRRLLRRIEAGESFDRRELYNGTLIAHWVTFGLAVALWFGTGRDWAAVGVNGDVGSGFLLAAALTVVGIVFLVGFLRHVTTADLAELRKIRSDAGSLDLLIPRNGNELGRFYAVSVSAGIVEEFLWRGFLIWYLAHFMPVWAAAVFSAVGFGIAHAYQGAAHLPKITLVGAGFALLYVLSGSLWLPMIMHAAVDMLQGRAAYEIVRRTGGDDRPPSPSAENGNDPAAVEA